MEMSQRGKQGEEGEKTIDTLGSYSNIVFHALNYAFHSS